MKLFRMLVVGGLWLGALSCLSLAQEDKALEWAPPLVQQVRMPGGIQAGIYYPEHDEWVLVKPGAWIKDKPLQVDGKVQVPDIAGGKDQDWILPVTLKGRIKLSEALKMITEAEGKSFVLGAGVEDKEVQVDVRQAPVPQALGALLDPYGYGFKLNGHELWVLARDTRVFRVNLPPVTQAFDTTTTNESSNGTVSGTGNPRVPGNEARLHVGAKVLVENISQPQSFWQDIEANVKSLMSPGGVVSLNKAAGIVVVTDAWRELDKIEAFMAQMNTLASQQITVDVKVVEVELSQEHKLGIDWGAVASSGSLKGLNFTTNFASENIVSGNMMTFAARANKEGSGDDESGVKAVLKALESFGRIEVVSQPRIMMLNNSVASIQVGETKAFVESTNMETTQSGGTITSASLNQVHGGVTLQIMGSIVGDDVFLNATPVVSTIDDIRTIALGGGNKLEAPDTSIKTMSTMVRVKAGRTVAIGGLITRDKSRHQYGVPFLSRIPVLGKAFSYELRRNRRTELVIFMTPRRG